MSRYQLLCQTCQKKNGEYNDGVLKDEPNAPPIDRDGGRIRCGFCGGNLYLDPEPEPEQTQP